MYLERLPMTTGVTHPLVKLSDNCDDPHEMIKTSAYRSNFGCLGFPLKCQIVTRLSQF